MVIDQTEQSYPQLDSRKQVVAFWGRVTITTTNYKGSSTLTRMSKMNTVLTPRRLFNFGTFRRLSEEDVYKRLAFISKIKKEDNESMCQFKIDTSKARCSNRCRFFRVNFLNQRRI